MRSDKHVLRLNTHGRVARRQLLQAGGVVAGSAMAAGGAFPARAMAAGVSAEHVPAWLDLLSRAISTLQDDYTPVALSDTEIATLRAAVGRLIPTDELGPGAADAGVHVFIDRGLAGPNAAVLPVYQAMLAALEGNAEGNGFAATTPERQDELLTELEAGEIADAPEGAFALLLEHTREGMFGDPVYGGNQNFVGWDLIGYPGIKLLWTQADQEIGAVVKPQHLSVEQFGGTGW
jgi:gluconate 2-dehydrogenase gamma chain